MKTLFFICSIFLMSYSYAQIAGCTDPMAINFNASATQNDGSCTYASATITPTVVGQLPDEVIETSGLMWFNNQLVTHNDDTDIKLYFLDTLTGALTSSLTIPDVTNLDWEDIDQDDNYLYVGDFGNNVNGNRTNLRIFRIAKNSLLNEIVVDTINFSYSNQTNFTATGNNNTNFDCEAMIVSHDYIYLFSKQWVDQKSTIYRLAKTPGVHTADSISTINVQGLVTGATYLEDKRLVALSGYSTTLQPFIYLLYDFTDGNFLGGNKRKVSLSLPFHQVEAITTHDGLNYFITNEQLTYGGTTIPSKLMKFNLSNYLSHYINPDHLSVDTENSSQLFQCYPNPLKDQLYIRSNEDGWITITSLDGRLVQTNEVVAFKEMCISINPEVTTGWYIVTFQDKDSGVFSRCKIHIFK